MLSSSGKILEGNSFFSDEITIDDDEEHEGSEDSETRLDAGKDRQPSSKALSTMMVPLSETETEQCEMTMPQEWYFTKGDFIMAGSQVRVVQKIDCAGVEIELEGTFTFQFHRWQDIVKLFDIRDFVQVVGGEFIVPPELNLCPGPLPYELSGREHMGPVPWQGLQVLILSMKTRHLSLDHLRSRQLESHGECSDASLHKGKKGMVQDILLHQPTASGLKVCIRLDQNYGPMIPGLDLWFDYDSVMAAT
ncbi:hypothetical protein EDD85DRAFT_793796 [Armillaria nabsnona]|nr:hypothetical protein EDD85DRAFT_793796 [Armillaria nabsnona]